MQFNAFLFSCLHFSFTSFELSRRFEFGFFLAVGVDDENGEESSGDDDSSSTDDDDEDGASKFKDSARPRGESIEDKKLRKKMVKDAKAEKRKNKLPKHMKKRKEKQSTKKK